MPRNVRKLSGCWSEAAEVHARQPGLSDSLRERSSGRLLEQGRRGLRAARLQRGFSGQDRVLGLEAPARDHGVRWRRSGHRGQHLRPAAVRGRDRQEVAPALKGVTLTNGHQCNNWWSFSF